MNRKEVVVERTFHASVEEVWKALTDKDQLKEWYFEVSDFEPVPGFEFRFYGENEGIRFLHICTVVEVERGRRLSYTWRYEGYPGESLVTFDLVSEGTERTRLTVTHRGLDTFPADSPHFVVENFNAGWNGLFGQLLRHLEGRRAPVPSSDDYGCEIDMNATVESIYDALTNRIPQWWTEQFEGSADRQGSIFTVRFGDRVFKTMNVKELSSNARVVWSVVDAKLDIPGVDDPTEWIGTTIVWDILRQEDHTRVRLTHIGLRPIVSCHEICADGWRQFVASLKSYVESGAGTPFGTQDSGKDDGR